MHKFNIRYSTIYNNPISFYKYHVDPNNIFVVIFMNDSIENFISFVHPKVDTIKGMYFKE